MKNIYKFLGAFAITIFLVSLFSKSSLLTNNKSDNLKDIIPFYLGCQNPEEGIISVSSKVIVHQDFINKFNIIKDPKAAVNYQLSYLQGYFYYSNNQASLITENIKDIEILGLKVTNYKRNLEVAYDERFFHYLYPDHYKNITYIKEDDRAVEISYKAKIKGIKCLDYSSENIYAKLPIDPYLAYWSMPQDKFLTFKAFGKTTLTNPCLSLRYIQLSYPPVYWYFWKPDASGVDFFKNKYNCNKELEVGRDIIIPDISFNKFEITSRENNISKILDNRKVKISLIMGVIGKETPENFEKISLVIENRQKLDEILKSWTIHGNDFSKNNPDIDVSLWAIINNIKELQSISSNIKIEYKKLKQSGILTLSGTLDNSKKEFVFDIYIGLAGKSNKYNEHWTFLKESLLNSQFVLYIAHSDYGKNLDLYRMKEKLGLSEEELVSIINKQDYQLFGALNCFSTTYHSEEYFNLRDKSKVSDLLLLASEGYSLRVPFGILNYLDKEDSFIKNIRLSTHKEDRVILRRKSND